MNQSLPADLPCLCTALRAAAHKATLHYDKALEPAGVSVTMFRLLRRVARLSKPSLTDLAADLDLDRSTLGRNVRVLERQGFTVSEAGADSRAAVVRLTEAGWQKLQECEPLWQQAQTEMAGLLGPHRDEILTTLADMGAATKQMGKT